MTAIPPTDRPEPPVVEGARSPSPEPRRREGSEGGSDPSFVVLEEPEAEPELAPHVEESGEFEEPSGTVSFDSDTPIPNRKSTGSRRDSVLRKTPACRSQTAFVRSGLTQSVGGFRHHEPDLDMEDDPSEEEHNERTLEAPNGTPIIDGRELTVAAKATDVVNFAPVRMWDKTERSELPADVKQAFVRAATGCALPETNKLSVHLKLWQLTTSSQCKCLTFSRS